MAKKKLSKATGWLKLAPLFLVGFVIIGAITYFTRAAVPDNSLEPELGTRDACVNAVDSTTASGGKGIAFICSPPVTPPPTTGKVFVHPGVVFTKAQIDSWTTSSPEYTRLANTGAGSLTNTSSKYTPVVFGTRIDCGSDPCDETEIRNTTNELNLGFKDQSGYAKVQAVLWAADNNAARKTKVISYLDQYKTVTSMQWDYIEQYRLVGGWACTNLTQAAEIINYQDTQFKRFLKDVCYPMMDWGGNPNWHASFADSKLAIAAYLGDEALWTDAKRYFNERIKQSIYHSKYDGTKVNPMHNEDQPKKITNSSGTQIGSTVNALLHTGAGTPNFNATNSHWKSQLNSDYTIKSSFAPNVDGVNAERPRDFNHVNMSYVAWVNAARTIQAQGEQLEPQARDRILAGWDYHAQRVYHYLSTGTYLAPAPAALGDSQYNTGFCAARTFLGSATPQSVKNALTRTEVRSYAPAGSNHMVAEPFTDCNGGF